MNKFTDPFWLIEQAIRIWGWLLPVWTGALIALPIGYLVFFIGPLREPDDWFLPHQWMTVTHPITGQAQSVYVESGSRESALWMFPFAGAFVGTMVKIVSIYMTIRRKRHEWPDDAVTLQSVQRRW